MESLHQKSTGDTEARDFEIGEALVLGAFSIFALVAGTNVFIVLPALPWAFRDQVILLIGGLFVFVNMVSAYACAAFADPGVLPHAESSEVDTVANESRASLTPEPFSRSTSSSSSPKDGMMARARCAEGPAEKRIHAHQQQADLEAAALKPTYCDKCSRMRPARAHHCRQCRRCILKMDHHCPWLNNCVGYHNHKYFCVFLAYLAIGSTLTVLISLDFAIDAVFFPKQCAIAPGWRRWCVLCSWFVCALSLLGDSCVGSSQLYLVLTNQTTIEQKQNFAVKERARLRRELALLRRSSSEEPAVDECNPYDVGCAGNLREVFGEGPLCCLIWFAPSLGISPLQERHSQSSAHREPIIRGGASVSAGRFTYDEVVMACTVLLTCAYWIGMLSVVLRHLWHHLLTDPGSA